MIESLIFRKDLKPLERWLSMLFDHLFYCMLILPLTPGLGQNPDSINRELDLIISIILYGLYLNKDFLNGQSLAKRLTGQIILHRKTQQPASAVRCVLRNSTIFLFPLEILVVYFSPSRRIGDLLANTQVLRVEKSPPVSWKREWGQFRPFNVVLALFLAAILAYVIPPILFGIYALLFLY